MQLHIAMLVQIFIFTPKDLIEINVFLNVKI